MTATNVRKTRGNSQPQKPAKPRPDFPLTPVKKGKWVGWVKKVKGVQHYFSGTADEALREWLAVRDDLFAGRDPRRERPGETVGWLCNAFMDSRKARRDAGELSQRSLDDYHAVAKRLAAHFKKPRRLETLGPADFASLRASFPKTWGPVSVANEIGRVNVILNWAYDTEVVDRPIRTGPDFRRPAKRVCRKSINAKPAKLFTADQINAMVDAAGTQMRAMVLLGINAAYGNHDCGQLRQSWIDPGRQWLDRMRHKNGVPRECWLWPETLQAINAAIDSRPDPHDPDHSDLVFVTKYGQPWVMEVTRGDKRKWRDAIPQEFTKLKTAAGIDAPGVGFYSLRHTFQTVASNSRDQVAVDWVFGHERRQNESRNYLHGIDTQRIIDVCGHVRDWLNPTNIETGGDA